MNDALARILDAAARGAFPPPDGGHTVVRQPSPRDAGVLAFTAHSVVFTDEDPAWVAAALRAAPADPLAASLSPPFLTAFTARTGRQAGHTDLLSCAAPLPGPPDLPLREIRDQDHPRVSRARKYRDDVRVWAAEGGIVVLGRGVAGRWEIAVEVAEAARGRGLGRALVAAARHLMPENTPLWAQQPPGNARSVRAFQAAGYRPVCAEVLFVSG
ncbi:GNAT family N-acetyltransferase [Streptomyces johnsoniae]|uniref:GNAT family N-acetyltransferase n=1 Tax=Streptomyces johnsoniae TaxID=3075532 RepID=A0ABU2S071_9ACTN|nr:GNAT family N-acetyltransferase [Streptomyces sp. DSM 41886]MDT0442173.1 GNAT family N-acetyltransferase [Streptomyces sp. DSM 41886]